MRRARIAVRSPLAWIVLTVAVLHVVGIGWGLPSSDGWDNDGVAPRDILPGLAETFAPGRFYTYPPLHLAILAVLTAPVTLVAVFRSPSFHVDDVVRTILAPGYMTSFSIVARVVALAMSLGVVVAVARLAEELRAAALGVVPVRTSRFGAHFDDERVRRAGWCAAAFVGMNASLTYYGKTSNLDVPYLFWSVWGLIAVARAVARNEPRRLRAGLVLAALAACTKDQAYALFLFSVPVLLLLSVHRMPWRRTARELAIAAGLCVATILVVDGAVFNPSGFRARVAFLTGSASKDYVAYTNDWTGRIGVVVDAARRCNLQYPFVAVPLVAVGLWRSRRSPLGWWPLLVAVSFTIGFNWSALRTDARFLLPQGIALAVYGGLGLEALVFGTTRARRVAGQAAASIVLAAGVFCCVAVDENMLEDPRYDVEQWLAANVQPGDVIETYGLNVYLPRFPPQAHVIRVGPQPVDRRNPLPGVEEIAGPYDEALSRPARWIVLPTAWAWRYFHGPHEPGRILPPTVERQRDDERAAHYFQTLVDSRGGFVYVHGHEIDSKIFPLVDVHGTTGRVVWVYRREK